MENSSSHSERRKHERYQVQSLVIAVPSKTHLQVGRIVNISKGGLAVRYVDQKDWLGEENLIDIFVNSDFFMTGVPIESVKDFMVDNLTFFSIISERQCCLQFGHLSPAQENLLDEFITQHTAGNS